MSLSPTQPPSSPPPPPPPASNDGQPPDATQLEPDHYFGCWSGYSQTYDIRGGRATGIVQLLLGLIIVIINALTFITGHKRYPNEGHPIGIAILFIIPAGIIGIMTKSRRNSLIISYLVMSILCTINGFVAVINEGLAAALYSYELICSGPYCYWDTSVTVIILHLVCAIVIHIESVVAIVSLVYCSRGLFCCRECCCYEGNGDETSTISGFKIQDWFIYIRRFFHRNQINHSNETNQTNQTMAEDATATSTTEGHPQETIQAEPDIVETENPV